MCNRFKYNVLNTFKYSPLGFFHSRQSDTNILYMICRQHDIFSFSFPLTIDTTYYMTFRYMLGDTHGRVVTD